MNATSKWLTLVVALALAGCKAHHLALAPHPVTVTGRTVTFPSGLRLVMEQESGSRRVAVALLVGAGGAQDPQGKEGLAHFVEHLAFRSRPAGRLSAMDELDYAGVGSAGSSQPNAQTGFESTIYLGLAPASRLAQVLPLAASLVTRPLQGVDDATVDVEREVLRAERYDVDPHAGGAALDAVFQSVLPRGFPGSRPVAGTDPSLRAVTRADLEAFVDEHYRPDNTIVVLIGDLSPRAAEAYVRAAFPANWVNAAAAVPPRNATGVIDTRVPDPPATGERLMVESRVPRRRLVFSWAVPGLAQPAGVAMPLLRHGLGLSRKKPPGVRRLWTELAVDTHLSALSLVAELEPDARPDAVSAELRKAKLLADVDATTWRHLAEDLLFDEQALLARAEHRAQALFATGNAHLVARGPSEAELASLKIVQDRVLTWDRAREVLVVPYVRTTGAEAATRAAAPPRPRRLTLDPVALAQVSLGPWLGADLKHFTLQNGLEVVLSPRRSMPVVTVALGLPARAQQTRLDVPVFLEAALRWDLDENTWQVGWPDAEVGADATVISLSGLSTRLPLMLDVLGHNLPPRVAWFTLDQVNDALGKLERERERDDTLDELLKAEQKSGALLRQVVPPRSSAVAPQLADLHELSRAPYVELVDHAWRPNGAWLVVDGDLDPAATEALVHELFDDWPGNGAAALPAAPAPAPPRQQQPLVVENQDAAATTVRLACRLPPQKTAAERGGAVLLKHALAAWFEDELRQQLGVTYGVRASVTRWAWEDNVLTLDLTLSPAGKQAALRRFLEKLNERDGALWEEQLVDVARWHAAKEALADGLRSTAVASGLARAGAAGVPFEALVAPPSLAEVPLRAVDDAWEACADSLALELEGERSSIDAALRDAGRKAP